MNKTSSQKPLSEGDDPAREGQPAERPSDEADEGQVDQALEETFPASDPISP